MRFEYSDAWLLEAIKFSQNGDKGATLTDIIQAADYINHAIMTNSEFATGTRKLKSLGLIIEKISNFRQLINSMNGGEKSTDRKAELEYSKQWRKSKNI